jgi:hypothetical protein
VQLYGFANIFLQVNNLYKVDFALLCSALFCGFEKHLIKVGNLSKVYKHRKGKSCNRVGIHRANFADFLYIGFKKLLFTVASLYWIYPLFIS